MIGFIAIGSIGRLAGEQPGRANTGAGPGRGIGVLFILCGVTAIVVSRIAYLNPRIRLVEEELPDAIQG